MCARTHIYLPTHALTVAQMMKSRIWWSEHSLEIVWFQAQLVFPICATVSLGAATHQVSC